MSKPPLDPAVEEILGSLADSAAWISELPPNRQFAIARTKIQEAILWLLSDQVIDEAIFTNKVDPKETKNAPKA